MATLDYTYKDELLEKLNLKKHNCKRLSCSFLRQPILIDYTPNLFNDLELFSKLSKDYYRRIISDIICIGAGGVASWFLPQLIKALHNYSIKNNFIHSINITIMDHDTVSESNLLRQNFIPEDLGRNKAEVLAERYSEIYPNIKVIAKPYFLKPESDSVIFKIPDMEENNSKYSCIDTRDCDVVFNFVDNEYTKHIIDESFGNCMYFSTGCDLYNGHVFAADMKYNTYTEYYKSFTFESEEVDLGAPACARAHEEATAEQSIDSNTLAVSILSTLFNNYLANPYTFSTERVNFISTVEPSVNTVSVNYSKINKFIYNRIGNFLDELYAYLVPRGFEWKKSSKTKEFKSLLDLYDNYSNIKEALFETHPQLKY